MNQVLCARSTLACVILSFAIPACHGQFDALPDSNAVWYDHFWDPWTYDWSATYYMSSELGDTLINDTVYSALRGYGNWSSWPGIFCGGLFDNGIGQVYYYHPNTSSTNLLMDFDVMPGDSVVNVSTGSAFDNTTTLRTLYIVQVDTILIGNRWRKAIGIVGAPPAQIGYDPIHWWIEGIGGTGGLLETSGLMALDISGGLECMSLGDSILWHWGPAGYPGSCLSVGIEEESNDHELRASPNPSTGRFQLSGNFQVPAQVFDVVGSLVAAPTSSTIDLTTQPPGIYTAVITSSAGRQVLRLVVER